MKTNNKYYQAKKLEKLAEDCNYYEIERPLADYIDKYGVTPTIERIIKKHAETWGEQIQVRGAE